MPFGPMRAWALGERGMSMRTGRRIRCRLQQMVFRAAMPLLPYREPEIMQTMEGVAAACVSEHVARVLIVTGPRIAASGMLDDLTHALEKAHVSYRVFDRVVPNPTVANVEDAREEYLHHDAHGIIAIGGGSPMDCAKATARLIADPDSTLSDARGISFSRRPVPLLVCVPTTAGSGSETTVAAVVTDEAKRLKYAINDFRLIPKYAVLDARLTASLPPSVTAQTGMDALTHAVEAYIGRSTTRRTRAMSKKAVSLIHGNLLRAYRHGGDLEARDAMLKASYCAGVAFTRSYVGYVHAMAHALGGRYGIAHGLANAIILPHMLRAYGHAIDSKLARLARVAGIASRDMSAADAAAAFIAWIDETNASMGMPRYVEGVQEIDIPQMALDADAEANPLYPVPVLMDEKELRRMFYVIAGSRVE